MTPVFVFMRTALFDRIAELEHRTIVEDGTHAELSQTKGVYESLWDTARRVRFWRAPKAIVASGRVYLL